MASSSFSSTSSSSSSSRIARSLHDVFLSFRGADTRTSFMSHLLVALDQHDFSTFRDDTKLPRGEPISSELLKAIEESRVSIVVFSKNYAASRWCLDELVKIMECKRDFNRIVLPIFYDVDPSHVRAQLGSYSEAFTKHEDRVKEGISSMDRVESWRAALTEAANLSGYHLQNGDEATLINIIVKDIDTFSRLDGVYSDVADHPVGIDDRVQELKELLNLGSHDVRIVAVWGVGGIGKTTIAKALFNRIRNKFEGSSFLADVRENAQESSGVVKLQKQLLSNILKNDINNLDNYLQGIDMIKQKIHHRRVLLVLDDVDDVQQLKKLAIRRDFFHLGSRIIITTRNKSSISSLQVDSVYLPEMLNEVESLKLFSWNAFNTGYPKEEYRHMSEEVVAYAEGLPLVLEVLGSFLSNRSTTEWKSDLDKLKAIPNGHIQQKLKVSYDSLDDKNKELFLDIAFFFIGRDKDFTVKVLEDSGCFPESGIRELASRCLVKVDECGDELLRMHDVLRDMGREIVRQQSLKEPGKRSRLWYKEEVLEVLRDCSGPKAIEGLSLELPALNNEHVNTKGFANMSKLRLLHLNYLQCLSGSYITTSRNLKWLCWLGFPLAYIPHALYMENLVAIDLQHSKLKQIWKGPKRLDKLRFLNLSHSYHLTKTPDFSGLKKLEKLFLNDCTSLVKVHNSIGYLDKLLLLNMSNCINLRKVPSSLFMLKSLKELVLVGCSKLGELAECKLDFSMFRQWLTKRQEYIPISMASIQGLRSLQVLNLAGCNMEYIPNEIGSLISLRTVDFSNNNFCSLPSSFRHLSRLQHLCMDGYLLLKSLTDLPKNLISLTANNCLSLETASIGMDVVGCRTRSTSLVNSRMEFRNCLKLDGKSLSNNFKRENPRLRVRQGPPSSPELYNDYYSLIIPGRELPIDMQFQSIGTESLSFVVPPLVGKKIIGLIVCAVFSYNPFLPQFEIIIKTKGIRKPDDGISHWELLSRWWPRLTPDEHHVWITYKTISDWEFVLEGGDEVDIIPSPYFFGEPDEMKRWGLSLIYEDDDLYLESGRAITTHTSSKLTPLLSVSPIEV